ncbi:MAG: hypothetical protein WDO13_02620 [Verrucomicrobiota bacterium]
MRGQPGESVVKIGLLKSLKRAMYSPKPLGHYGLAKMKLHALHLAHPALLRPARASRALHPGPQRRRRPQLRRPLAARAASLHHRAHRRRCGAGIGAAQEAGIFRPAGARHAAHVVPALILEVRSSGLRVQLPEFVVEGMVPLSGLQGDLFVLQPAAAGVARPAVEGHAARGARRCRSRWRASTWAGSRSISWRPNKAC